MSKKIDKAVKLLGEENTAVLDSASTDELRKRIAYANSTIAKTKEELEANANYIKAKDDKAALDAGFRGVRDENQAVIDYALFVLTGRGEVNK